MRIHTNLTAVEVSCALRAAGDNLLLELTRHGSRSRPHAFEVRLEGFGERHTRRPQGNPDAFAATWSDWGRFLAALYDRDPAAVCTGAYSSANDFHARTAYVFHVDATYGPRELADAVGKHRARGLSLDEAIDRVASITFIPYWIVKSAIFGEGPRA